MNYLLDRRNLLHIDGRRLADSVPVLRPSSFLRHFMHNNGGILILVVVISVDLSDLLPELGPLLHEDWRLRILRDELTLVNLLIRYHLLWLWIANVVYRPLLRRLIDHRLLLVVHIGSRLKSAAQ